MNDYADLQPLLKFLRVKPWCSDHIFHECFMQNGSDRVTSSFLTPVRNKVLVATFQSLAIRRERDNIFDEDIFGSRKPGKYEQLESDNDETEDGEDELKAIRS